MELDTRIAELSVNINEDKWEESEECKIELQKLREKKTEGMIIRSRVQWIREGEKPSRYFCSLESRNFIDRSMSILENNERNIISNQREILKEVKDFYAKLYSDQNVRNVDLDQTIRGANKLTQEESNLLEGPLTLDEISEALKNTKNNKSPGSDGFTVEFYIFFFIDIGTFLVKIFE